MRNYQTKGDWLKVDEETVGLCESAAVQTVGGSAVEGRFGRRDGGCNVWVERSGLLAAGLGGRGRLRESLRGFKPGGEVGNCSSVCDEWEEPGMLVSK